MLKPGDLAPDFELPTHTGGTVKLADFRGRRNVLVAFHPLAFTPVCARQMAAYEADRERLAGCDTHVLGISADAQPSKAAWAHALGGVSFDLLSDFHPHGEVARRFGVMRDDGIPDRAVFVVDKTGTIRFAKRYAIPEQPDNAEVFAVLETLAGSSG
jgi:peroxiredoxin